jgi:hypothetical protein
MEIEEQKSRVVQAVVGTGLFPTSKIYEQFYEMTPTEIDMIKKDLDTERQEQNMTAMAQQGGQPGATAPGTPGTVGPAGQAPLPPEQPAANMATQEELESYFNKKYKDKPEIMSLMESYLDRNQE